MDLNVKLQGLKFNYEKVQGCFCKILRLEIKPIEPVSRVLISVVHRRSDGWGGAGSRSRRRIAVEHGGSPEFEFSRATEVGFRWGLLLRDHSDEGNAFMLTLIGGQRQWSPATVRQLGRCLSTVRVASGEASAPRTCAKASSSSFLTSRLTNCSDQWLYASWLAAKNSHYMRRYI
jgi:hypothetical protein